VVLVGAGPGLGLALKGELLTTGLVMNSRGCWVASEPAGLALNILIFSSTVSMEGGVKLGEAGTCVAGLEGDENGDGEFVTGFLPATPIGEALGLGFGLEVGVGVGLGVGVGVGVDTGVGAGLGLELFVVAGVVVVGGGGVLSAVVLGELNLARFRVTELPATIGGVLVLGAVGRDRVGAEDCRLVAPSGGTTFRSPDEALMLLVLRLELGVGVGLGVGLEVLGLGVGVGVGLTGALPAVRGIGLPVDAGGCCGC